MGGATRVPRGALGAGVRHPTLSVPAGGLTKGHRREWGCGREWCAQWGMQGWPGLMGLPRPGGATALPGPHPSGRGTQTSDPGGGSREGQAGLRGRGARLTEAEALVS